MLFRDTTLSRASYIHHERRHTGAITGNILGALHGVEAVPEKWLTRLELRDTIAEVAEDLLIGFRSGDEWRDKYPGV